MNHDRNALREQGGVVIEAKVEHEFDTMYIAAGEIQKIQLGDSRLFLVAFEPKDMIHFIARVFFGQLRGFFSGMALMIAPLSTGLGHD